MHDDEYKDDWSHYYLVVLMMTVMLTKITEYNDDDDDDDGDDDDDNVNDSWQMNRKHYVTWTETLVKSMTFLLPLFQSVG